MGNDLPKINTKNKFRKSEEREDMKTTTSLQDLTGKEETVTRIFDLIDDISQDFKSLTDQFKLNRNLQIDHKTRFNNRVQVIIGHLLDILKVTDPNSKLLQLLIQCHDAASGTKTTQITPEELVLKIKKALKSSEIRVAENQKRAFQGIVQTVQKNDFSELKKILFHDFKEVAKKLEVTRERISIVKDSLKTVSGQFHHLILSNFKNQRNLGEDIKVVRSNLGKINQFLEKMSKSDSVENSIKEIGKKLSININFVDKRSKHVECKEEQEKIEIKNPETAKSKKSLRKKSIFKEDEVEEGSVISAKVMQDLANPNEAFKRTEAFLRSLTLEFADSEDLPKEEFRIKLYPCPSKTEEDESSEDLGYMECDVEVPLNPIYKIFHGIDSPSVLAFKGDDDYVMAKSNVGVVIFRRGDEVVWEEMIKGCK